MKDMTHIVCGASLAEWVKRYPVLQTMMKMESCSWFNQEAYRINAQEGLRYVGLNEHDIADARARLKRFAPYFVQAFSTVGKTNGILESPLVAVPHLQQALQSFQPASGVHTDDLGGRLWLKLDSHLPISGSIKARGGIYEVLAFAEQLAAQHGLVDPHDAHSSYEVLATDEAKKLFGAYKVAVGSTGNLGLSIGIMSATLGFQASVHMSADARQWKKDKLRAHGVEVVEYNDDYSKAVQEGRALAANDPYCYFVDDENSTTLFCGYAVATYRLKAQLEACEVVVDEDHPLFVYLPCGVGGGPGGVAFGLKTVFGDHVRIIFAEPTHCPSMFLGVLTQLHSKISVRDVGIDNVTAADGLACARPSGFVGNAMWRLIDGFTTVTDDDLYRLIALCDMHEQIRMEPSSAAGIDSYMQTMGNQAYLEGIGVSPRQLQRATHIAWITGGSMVPQDEMQSYIDKGRALLS